MRVLFFISSLECGGAENHLLNLCSYLSDSGHELQICSLSGPGGLLEDRFIKLGAGVDYLNISSLASFLRPSSRRRLRDIVSSFSPRIIHAHLYHAEAAAAIATFHTDAPLVVTRHSSGLEFNGIRRILTKAVSSRIDHLIAVSEEAGREAEKIGMAPRRISVIESGVDTSLFKPFGEDERRKGREEYISRLFGDEQGEKIFLIGSLGGLRPVKNYPMFVRVARKLIDQRNDSDRLRFVIIGDGDQKKELENLILELGLEGRFALPGISNSPQELLPLLDLFVLSSDTEGVPVALLEAFSCGLPCVASNVGGIARVADGNSLLPEPQDINGFVESIRSMIDNDRRREKAGLRNREIAVERYSLQRWGKRNCEVYLRLSGSGVRPV